MLKDISAYLLSAGCGLKRAVVIEMVVLNQVKLLVTVAQKGCNISLLAQHARSGKVL